jgi:Lon protease-like protein
MLADCLAGDRRFGITPTGHAQEAPDPGTVGCIAEVRVNQALPDGRSNIIVLGGMRFVIERLLPDEAPYYVASIETFDDQPGTAPPPDRTTRLREVFLQYRELLRLLNDLEPEDADPPADVLDLSFHASAAAECDPAIKQRLLSERSTAQRVEALLLLLPVLSSAAERGLEVHRRAHTNGKGGAQTGLATGS